MNKSSNRPFVLTALLLGTAAAATAHAQYSGPGAQAPAALPLARSVAEVLQQPTDDRPVELTGQLLRQTGRESFVFSDSTGEITVEIDAEDFPTGTPVNASARVQINGEVDARRMRKPTVDVDVLTVLPAATP